MRFLLKKKVRIMPVNEFEKQVQKKMDELQLRPSAEVWQQVEKRIRKEKKRRRLIIWFFLFGTLLLGAGSWWMIDGNKKQPLPDSFVQTTESEKVNETKTKVKTDTETITKTRVDNNNVQSNKKENISNQPNSGPAIINEQVASYNKVVAKTGIKKTYNEKEKINKINTGAEKMDNADNMGTDVSPDNIIPGKLIKNQKSNITIGIINDKKISNTDERIKNPMDTLSASGINLNDDSTGNSSILNNIIGDSLIEKKAETISPKDITITKKKKWEIVITTMMGISSKSDGISFFDGQKSLDAASLNSNPGGQVSTLAPAATQNGFSWQLGVYGIRELTKKTSVSLGINFSGYSTTQPAGIFVDSLRIYSNGRFVSSVNEFYRSGTGSYYKNHYYYLQAPIAFHWQINKSKKLPLFWQNGFSTGIFTGGNALVYNPASNVFYRDNKLFNKIQVAYQSGLYTKLWNQSKSLLTVGILFNYHLSKLQKVNTYGGNHLTSFGIQLGWSLKK
jgi:hypothetical protein